jgi:hypothetical protein
MKTWIKVLLVAIPVAVVALPLGQMLWPAATEAAGSGDHHAPALTGTQIGLFIGYSAIEAIFFGLGVAFILFGLPLVRRATGESKGLTWGVYLSLAWLMVSWLPHGGMHRSMGDNLNLLLAVEYIFHVSSMICVAITGYAFVRLLSRGSIEREVASAKSAVDMSMQPSMSR